MAKLSESEFAEQMSGVRDWSMIEEEGMKRLNRSFGFNDFAEALEFANRVGELAEVADHHPRMVVEWGRVDITWWSHSEGGVVAADFEMAKKVDAL